jgi:hypothetical protein
MTTARPEGQPLSNAWSYYVEPLATSIFFVIVGAFSLCLFVWGGRDADGSRRFGLNAIFGAVFGFAVGGTMGLNFLLTSPTPRERERIYDHVFRTPPERIERFIIKAGTVDQATPLTHTEVVIEDPARIRQITEILRTAGPEVSANHPRTKWFAVVGMVTRDGTYYFSALATVPGDSNGTLVSPWATERGGWNLGNVRADGLEEVLEGAVKKASKPD